MSKTSSYHQSLIESLADPDEAREYLRAVLEEYPEGFLKALRNVAQANQMSKVAKEVGIQRESLYRALSDNGNPRYETFFGVLNALDIKLTIADPKDTRSAIPSLKPGSTDELATTSKESIEDLLTGKPKEQIDLAYQSLLVDPTHSNIWNNTGVLSHALHGNY